MQIRISAYIYMHIHISYIYLPEIVNYFHKTVLLRCLTGVTSKPMCTLCFCGLPNLAVLFLSKAINLTARNIFITVIIATLMSICLNPLLHAVKS